MNYAIKEIVIIFDEIAMKADVPFKRVVDCARELGIFVDN